MQHIVGKILTRATTRLQTSSQLKVFMKNYGPQKLWESQLWEFRNSHLGVPGQNDIWVLVSWPGTKYTIRGKIVAFRQVQAVVSLVSPCLPVVHPCTKMLQLCTNLLFGLCRSLRVIELLVNLRSPISKFQHAPLPPKCYKPRSAPQLLLLSLFTFGFAIIIQLTNFLTWQFIY